MEIVKENIWNRILLFFSLKLFPLLLSHIPYCLSISYPLLFLFFLPLSLKNPQFISSNCWHFSYDWTFDIYWFVTVAHCIGFYRKFVRLENSYKLWGLSETPNIFVQAVFGLEFCFVGHMLMKLSIGKQNSLKIKRPLNRTFWNSMAIVKNWNISSAQ